MAPRKPKLTKCDPNILLDAEVLSKYDNCCVNCLEVYTESGDFVPTSEFLCFNPATLQERRVRIVEGIMIIFESLLRARGFDKTYALSMCSRCSVFFADLYRTYNDFLKVSAKDSLIHDILGDLSIWEPPPLRHIYKPRKKKRIIEDDDKSEIFQQTHFQQHENIKEENKVDIGSSETTSLVLTTDTQDQQSLHLPESDVIDIFLPRKTDEDTLSGDDNSPEWLPENEEEAVQPKEEVQGLRRSGRPRKKLLTSKEKAENIEAATRSDLQVLLNPLDIKRQFAETTQVIGEYKCRVSQDSITVLHKTRKRGSGKGTKRSKSKPFLTRKPGRQKVYTEEEKTCPICSLVCQTGPVRDHHVRVFHNKEKPFVCRFCEKAFGYKLSLEMHERSNHTAVDEFLFPCKKDGCERAFRTRRGLYLHNQSAHVTERNYICETCGKGFKARQFLKSHQYQHVTDKMEKVNPCPTCGKLFRFPKDVKIHMKLHADPSLLCNLCGAKFKQKHILKRHMDSIHGENKPHKCMFCEKSFVRKDHLMNHYRGNAHDNPLKGTRKMWAPSSRKKQVNEDVDNQNKMSEQQQQEESNSSSDSHESSGGQVQEVKFINSIDSVGVNSVVFEIQ